MPPNLEALFRLYEDAIAHFRHLEEQRSTFATVLLAVAGAVVAFGLPEGNLKKEFFPGLLLVVIGVYGALLSWKQNEKINYYRRVSDALRSTIEGDSLLAPYALHALRRREDCENSKQYLKFSKVPVGLFWSSLYVLIVAIGVFLFWRQGGFR